MRNFSLFLKLTLIVGIIGLLNFTNFDLGSNTSLNNSLATENTQSQEATLIENASNPDSTKSKEIYTVQKANTDSITNLAATDTFDPDAIPYFRTETCTFSSSVASITIFNHWTSTIKVVFTLTNGSIDQTYDIDPVSSKILNISYETGDLTISAIDKDGFRNWAYVGNGFIETSGESESQFASFVHIPDMRYFTTDASGTRADDYFFTYFFRNSKATSLPEGSFDTSSITSVGNYFFSYFNNTGSLTSLPVNSFDISTITSVGNSFFYGFNYWGSLNALPVNSFNTSSITTAGTDFFNSFNYSGRLTALPVYSFDISTITSVGKSFFERFNYSGSLTTLPANSFNTSSITNVEDYFFAWFNSTGSLTVLPVNSFNSSNITSVGIAFFYGFNWSGSLTSLPANSFDTSSITNAGSNFFNYFNNGGQITKNPSSGISIMNPSGGTVTFYYAPDNEYDTISSGGTFSYYNEDPFTMSFDSVGGSDITPITATRGEKFTKPANPTKSGYKFIQWVLKDGTVYDWDSTATDNLTLYAQWEEVPSPTPTTSPTESPTTSPTPTKSPTSSPSPSSSNSLPVTGDDSWNIFTFGGISLFVGMILLTLSLVNRRSKRIPSQKIK